MKRLGDLVLPDSLQWTDRWEWSPVSMETARTLGGTLVTWSQGLTGGQPITLEATDDTTWLTFSQVNSIQAMARQSGAVLQLLWDDEEYRVMFRHDDSSAISFRPLWPHHGLYVGTIRLMGVG